MASIHPSRRQFMADAALFGTRAMLGAATSARAFAAEPAKLHIACNQYPWLMFYQRDKKDFAAALDAGFAEVAQCGADGFEPMIASAQQVDDVAALLKKHGLEMRSLYVNSTLHVADQVEKSTADIVAIAQRAKAAGTRIIVTNPSPIQWGGPQDRTTPRWGSRPPR